MARNLSRRQWIAGVAGATAGMGLAASASTVVRRAFTLEVDYLVVTRHAVGAPPAQPGAPRLRVAQISDLHIDAIGSREERVAAVLAVDRPDLIVFTGDSVDQSAGLAVLGAFLDLLERATRKIAIVGNRERSGDVDVRRLERTYAQRNCELLINDVAEFSVGGRAVLITGLDDLIGGTPDPARALVGAAPTPNHLLLAHCPAQRDRIEWHLVSPASTARIPDGPQVDLALYRPQWMLAGHTHGGQIAPFGVPLMRPRGSGRYVSGWYRDPAPPMYVSRGIGTSLVAARHRVRPEVALFDWGLV
jgi:predicted MPP superfamily phosphohydrolase